MALTDGASHLAIVQFLLDLVRLVWSIQGIRLLLVSEGCLGSVTAYR
jgi:hypothetical protein